MKRYRIIYSKDFQKLFKKVDPSVQRLVAAYIKHNLENTNDPRARGKALIGDKKGLWRYRIANYRLIVEIRDDTLIILVLTFGHRSDVYK
jgi:mRNA interferase RelE/StbE